MDLRYVATHGTLFVGSRWGTEASMAKEIATKRKKRTPVGDRIQFLAMLSPEIVKQIKHAAVEDERAAWDVMEEAATEWLKRRKAKRAS